MTDVGVVKVVWADFPGSPGLSQFAVMLPDVNTLSAVPTALSSAFSNLASYLPSGLTLHFPGDVEIFQAETGTLIDSEVVAGGNQVAGTGTGSMISAGGAAVTWLTGSIQNGRRVRGRTFIVPSVEGMFDTDGTLSSGAVTALNAFGQDVVDQSTLSATSRLAVWGRPRDATADRPAKPFSLAPISNFSLSDKMAVLRGRRD